MKTKIIILLLVIQPLMLFAQPYKSYFGEEYTKWYVLNWGSEGYWTSVYLTCYNITEEIDGMTYKSLFDVRTNENLTTVPPKFEYLYRQGYLREDLSTGQLFFREDKNTQEVIVSDMSLEVGDSVRLLGYYFDNLFHSYWENVIISEDNIPYAIVDSVYCSDRLKHIRSSATIYNPLTNTRDNLVFIEALGSNISPLFDFTYFTYPNSVFTLNLICYETENKLIHFSDHDCYWRDLGIDDLKKYSKVREEMNAGMLNLYFDIPFSGQINLIDYSGRTLYQKNIFNETRFNVDVSNFSKGIYILQIWSIDKECLNKKTVIF
jgi:hypothetical protein